MYTFQHSEKQVEILCQNVYMSTFGICQKKCVHFGIVSIYYPYTCSLHKKQPQKFYSSGATNLYPAPRTVCIYFVFRGSGSIFFRSWLIQHMTAFSKFIGSSFQTAL